MNRGKSCKFNGDYIKCLSGSDLVRYTDLIKLCGGVDPCEIDLKNVGCDEKLMPNVNLIHVMDYLVNTTRSSTMDKMRNYNSSDAYRFLVDGWIKSILFVKVSNGLIVCLGRVKHSFRVDEPDNKPWALVKDNGEILCGWCTCKAGCGESCNHLAGMLYALEYGASRKSGTSCTSKACSWLPPHLKDVPYSRIQDIDFQTPANKRKRLMFEEEDVDSPSPSLCPATPRPSVAVSEDDISKFFENLNLVSPSSAIFRVLPKYCDNHAPPKINFPCLNLFHKDNCNLTLTELRSKGEDLFRAEYKISVEQHLKVEELTRQQSSSKVWFLVRKGRIGGSTVHSVMTTDCNNPSITSVHNVCDPMRPQRKTQWMIQGSLNEPVARKEYYEFMGNRHYNFSIQQCGAKIPLEYPFLIASTDGEVQCDCCGKGILEIKCTKDPNDDEDNIPPAHYDQIQHYLLCLGPDYKYADYVVWHKDGPTRKRTFPDPGRQQEILDKCELYCRNVAMPELMGRYFSSLKNILDNLSISAKANTRSSVICYCQKPAQQPVVVCMGKSCTFVKFHLRCVSLKTAPKKWLCPECKPSSLV